jgi:hypothetical protein
MIFTLLAPNTRYVLVLICPNITEILKTGFKDGIKKKP